MMKSIVAFALVALSAGRSVADVGSAFAKFKQDHARQYSSAAEEHRAFQCFTSTLADIDRLNALDSGATYGINKFSDICKDDFKRMYLTARGARNRSSVPREAPLSEAELAQYTADSFDWRDHGVVLPVKDQGQCGSCWTFSAVAAMESAWKLANHTLTSLSEEELVQCAKSAGDGCNGGDELEAIQWVINHGGITTEGDYPYSSGRGVTGRCNTVKSSHKVAKFKSVIRAPSSETQIKAFLQKHGVLTIAVDAEDAWQSYQSGVKTLCKGRDLDHAVSLVGFGPDYWIVRNSWSSSWGEGGYIRLKMGVNCDGMADEVGTATA
eukprot:NODE_2494_length_1187_cov_35.036907_g2277_i0.p1 GENE.NODE_2494_length_1187_cov_35.036907_g2277_i0~~NODE_2494_length_1187_cov_35.036907_g2277_i0.p1  ORF type:complete len:343 (+),score=77.86 NODE_2494_length_1187_cov_35.036907_g2277_i0:60-1031(+)